MYTCLKCNEKRKCTKKLSIFKYPRVLVSFYTSHILTDEEGFKEVQDDDYLGVCAHVYVFVTKLPENCKC